jgi:hypothetical protein
MSILLFFWLFVSSLQVQAAAPCLPQRTGNLVGMAADHRALVLGSIDDHGRLKPAEPAAKSPCSRPLPETSAPETPEVKLGFPLTLVGLRQGKESEATARSLASPVCADGYYACPDEKTCEMPPFSDGLFFSKQPGQTIEKLNKPGKVTDVPQTAWRRMEDDLKSKIRSGYLCGYEFVKGAPGASVFRQAEKLSLPGNNTAYLAVLAMENTKTVMTRRKQDQVYDGGSERVFEIRLVNGHKLEPAEGIVFCQNSQEKPEAAAELKSLSAVRYGKYALIEIENHTKYILWSLANNGKVKSVLQVSNGQAECD